MALAEQLRRAGSGRGRAVDWCRARWEVETFFHVLKNGCRVEALHLGMIERAERALAVFMVWRGASLVSCA
ncbi:transposase [Paraburkholderia sp. J63]|uniref:transposase n=1 Tax=Paraburkholderia sp. J63 TaxID=2805434 RepID=UPI0039F61083